MKLVSRSSRDKFLVALEDEENGKASIRAFLSNLCPFLYLSTT
jgi:hypothetical protein